MEDPDESLDESDELESLDESDELESLDESDELESLDSAVPLSDFAAALVRLAVRSFFAQPDPLKWTVGGANALRMVPSLPQLGQNWGPLSFRPCRMSVLWSQAEQTYS